MNKKIIEFYVSVDIEATGPIPGKYSMSSLGAFVFGARYSDGTFQRFDHEKDQNTVFYAELKPLNDNFIPEAIKVGLLNGFDKESEDTDGSLRLQWMKDHGVEPALVMQEFADFVQNKKKELEGARPVFVAYPASFDWTFVYWYFVNFDVLSPFGFSSVLDMKSFYSARHDVPLVRSVKRYMSPSLFPDLPHTHRADDDAIEQGYLAMNIMRDFPA